MNEVFTIDNDEKVLARFRKGEIVDDVDRHGQRIKGRVVDVREGNRVALVSVKPEGET